jgi:hypothetical protein
VYQHARSALIDPVRAVQGQAPFPPIGRRLIASHHMPSQPMASCLAISPKRVMRQPLKCPDGCQSFPVPVPPGMFLAVSLLLFVMPRRKQTPSVTRSKMAGGRWGPIGSFPPHDFYQPSWRHFHQKTNFTPVAPRDFHCQAHCALYCPSGL